MANLLWLLIGAMVGAALMAHFIADRRKVAEFRREELRNDAFDREYLIGKYRAGGTDG